MADDDRLDQNQGEGNKEAGRRFNAREQKFVLSRRGQEQIQRAGDVSSEEAKALEKAERKGKERAREEDPQVHRDPTRPS
jgi:hypothetical protein